MSSPSRRSFIKHAGGLSLAALAGWPALTRAATTNIVVLTSYPPEVVARVQAAFEKENPNSRLRIVWRMPHDALPTLRQPGPDGIDVYWTPSPSNFAILARAGLLAKLDIDRAGLPGRIGNTRIDDPDGFYAATETAGYGFAINPEYLARHRLVEPADWSDLAAPAYDGHIVLPNPARVGFAPVMADIPLQAYGWERGWATWSTIVANSALIDRGSNFISDELTEARRGIGISIDFFVNAAIAKGAPIRFVYPKHGGINPGQVGILAATPNPQGAKAFVAFLLGDTCQKLLAHPDIRKLPVRPSVYASLPADYYNPFAAAEHGDFAYDNERGRLRLPVIAALFDVALARRQAQLAKLWRRARKATGKSAEEARRLLGIVPLGEAAADDRGLQDIFAQREDDAHAQEQAQATEKRWAAEVDLRLARVEHLLGAA